MLWFFECCQVLRLLELAEPHCYFLVQQIEQGGAAARPDTEMMSVLFLEFQFVTEVGWSDCWSASRQNWSKESL